MPELEKSNELVYLDYIRQKDGDIHVLLRTSDTNPAYIHIGKYREDGQKIEIKRADGTASTALLPIVVEKKEPKVVKDE